MDFEQTSFESLDKKLWDMAFRGFCRDLTTKLEGEGIDKDHNLAETRMFQPVMEAAVSGYSYVDIYPPVEIPKEFQHDWLRLNANILAVGGLQVQWVDDRRAVRVSGWDALDERPTL